MSTQRDLRRALDVTIVPHTAFRAREDLLGRLLQEHQEGIEPGIDMLLGPSRIGKSEILQRLAAKYPERREGGRLTKPVLLVSVPACDKRIAQHARRIAGWPIELARQIHHLGTYGVIAAGGKSSLVHARAHVGFLRSP